MHAKSSHFQEELCDKARVSLLPLHILCGRRKSKLSLPGKRWLVADVSLFPPAYLPTTCYGSSLYVNSDLENPSTDLATYLKGTTTKKKMGERNTLCFACSGSFYKHRRLPLIEVDIKVHQTQTSPQEPCRREYWKTMWC